MSKDTIGSNITLLTEEIQELARVINSTRQRAQKWVAWTQLQQTDASGMLIGSPYTVEALQTLQAAYQISEDDPSLLHHLAIAQHAYAWDLELAGETYKASEAWTKALLYWRKLQASDNFWKKLYAKGEQLKNFTSNFDIEEVKEFRINLIQYLLEIHVAFICHYYELGKREQAIRHIKLIQQAPLSPKDRKKLPSLIFDNLTASKAIMLSDGRFSAVLDLLDDCFTLIAYPPALIEYLQVARKYIDQMPPNEPLTDLNNLDQKLKLRWEELSQNNQLPQLPLGKSTLVDLAFLCSKKWLTRAEFLERERMNGNAASLDPKSEEYLGYRSAIEWLEKLVGIDPDNPRAPGLMYNACIGRYNYSIKLEIYSCELLRNMEQDLEQAYHIKPDDELWAILENIRQAIRDQCYTD